MSRKALGVKRRASTALCAAMLCVGFASPATNAGLAERVGNRGGDAALFGAPVFIQDDSIPLASTMVYKPQSGGSTVYRGSGATIDASNTSEGYVMIKYDGSSKKVKVQITKSGATTYTYDLNSGGKYEVYPLTNGDGSYKIGVYTNISGNQYAEALVKTVKVSLRDSFLPFLYPSQYVNFNENSLAVKKAEELARGASDGITVVQNVYNYCVNNISYDNNKAQLASAGKINGYVPVVDNVISTGKGICFDYAAVMASMLRSQEIPTRLEIGYVSNGAYHAWISTYIKEVGWINGIIQFDGKNWKLMDPTFAASLGDSGVTQYIGNGTNYKRQYIY